MTDRGIVEQRITEWEEGERLAFEMVSETSGLGTHVERMADRFTLVPIPEGTRLTRQTTLVPRGPCRRLRGIGLAIAVRRIHRFTMRGFRVAAEGHDHRTDRGIR